MPSECLLSLYSCIPAFEFRLGKYTVLFTNGELSPANTFYRKQCSDITALKLTYNMCNCIKCEIFLAV